MRIPAAQCIRRLPALVTLLIVCAASALGQKTSDAERQLFNSVNQERKAHGLPPLKYDEALATAARAHAQRMAEQGTISHQLPGEPNLLTRARAAGAHFLLDCRERRRGTERLRHSSKLHEVSATPRQHPRHRHGLRRHRRSRTQRPAVRGRRFLQGEVSRRPAPR